MQDPLDRANRYRKKAMKCGELAKYAQPACLGDFLSACCDAVRVYG